MTSPEPDFDALVDALRGDLPDQTDEQRVRRRLLAAGVGVAAGLVAPGAAAAATASSVPVALAHKLGALSWLTKVGLAGLAVTAAVPAVRWAAEPSASEPVQTAPASPRVTRSETPTPTLERAPRAEALPPESGIVPEREPAGTRSVPMPLEPLASDVRREAEPLPSTAAFPEDDGNVGHAEGTLAPEPEPAARSTLRAETALVERALYALRVGDRDAARAALAEHARLFPNGLLARERERALARASAAETPGSPAAPR